MIHQFKGHCQYCGRIQAVRNGSSSIATHGYTVEQGWFSGQCDGRDQLPLESSQAYLQLSVDGWKSWAIRNLETAIEVVYGRADPETIEVVRSVPMKGQVRTRVPFVEATEREQRNARTVLAQRLEMEAKGLTAHIEAMQKLAARVHGQDLLPNVDLNQKAPIAAGDKVRIAGEEVTVLEVKMATVHGIGPGLNGQVLPHAFYEAAPGKIRSRPVRLIRR